MTLPYLLFLVLLGLNTTPESSVSDLKGVATGLGAFGMWAASELSRCAAGVSGFVMLNLLLLEILTFNDAL